jgi:hypothetical protein
MNVAVTHDTFQSISESPEKSVIQRILLVDSPLSPDYIDAETAHDLQPESIYDAQE